MHALDQFIALGCVGWLILALTLLLDWWNQPRRPVH